MNLNKALIIGRLTINPEVRVTPSGTQVTSFGVATNRVWTDKSGQRKEDTEFHNVVVWGRQAEIVSQFLTKGSLIYIEGRIQTRTWQDQQNQNRKNTEIIAERIQLGPRPSGQSQYQQQSSNQAPPFPDQSQKFSKSENQNNQNNQNQNNENKKEDIPTINIDNQGEEIKDEDLPF